jgi:hypothetical protein
MHVLVRYRDEADTEFTWSTNGYAATIARDDAAMTDSGAERAARRPLFDECSKAHTFARIFRGSPLLAEEVGKLHKACTGKVTVASRGVSFECSCECHDAALPPAPEEGEKR